MHRDTPLPSVGPNLSTRTLYAVDAKGGGRNSVILRKMSANRAREIAASAIWNAAGRP